MAKTQTLFLKQNLSKIRLKILKAALSCFSKYGFYGTTVDRIVEKAKVNKRMVYHYFKDKEDLYRNVQTIEWEKLRKWFTETLDIAMTRDSERKNPKRLLIHALEAYYNFVSQNKDYLRLQIWEGLEGGKISREIWEKIRGPIYKKIESLAIKAREEDPFPRRIQPNHLVIIFLGAISYYFFHAHTMKDIFHRDPFSKEAILAHKNQMVAILETILETQA